MSHNETREEEVAVLLQHADVMLLQADFVVEAERHKLLAEAKDCLLRAERRAAGSGAWRLARMAARLGQDDLCNKWLLRAQANGRLPAAETLASDPGFQPVWAKPWFRKLLGQSGGSGA